MAAPVPSISPIPPPATTPLPPPPPARTSTKPHTYTHTVRRLPYTYLHLTLLSPSSLSSPTLASPDILTFRHHLTTAFSSYLGLSGRAIAIDILKTAEHDVWIRVARADGQAVLRALVAWRGEGVAWRIRGRGSWLGAVVGDGGKGVREGEEG